MAKTTTQKPIKIIVDGLDASGKSTLVDALSKEFNIPKRRETSKDVNTFDWYMSEYSNGSFVSDRSFISEHIFAPIFKRTPKVNDEECIKLHNYLVDNYTIFVVAINGSHKSFKTIHADRGEKPAYDYVIARQKWLNWVGVTKRFRKNTIIIGYDITKHKVEEVVNHVKTFVERIKIVDEQDFKPKAN